MSSRRPRRARSTRSRCGRSSPRRRAERRGTWDCWTDKAILITGAASGIGRATAEAAAAEGARLLLADVEDEQGEAVAAELGDGGAYGNCDVTDEASVQAAVAATVSELGRIDGAFDCAGILGTLGNTGELDSTAGSRSSTSTSTASSSAPNTSSW